MGRDLNPRYGYPYSGFQDRRLKPLGHPSSVVFIEFLSRHMHFPVFDTTDKPILRMTTAEKATPFVGGDRSLAPPDC